MPLVYLAVEVIALAMVWLVTRLRGEAARRVRVICPIDGRAATLQLVDVAGGISPSCVVGCSLQSGDRGRACDRACVRKPTCMESTR